ncbi:hypothetical protein DQ239_07905 [Blastococcus sp. TF02-09]|uniref:hypothetical protein n=1 Tax=Blastococcus sp. TF02-09 TaxID=2250576 RepID=UPI000DEAD9C8|nr:hypothetical protein [Blastococcus sp. TF02-9]RBY78481.1 hypothetical protein DQ239_07905 [Blastococcus sp. TF02-9]
MNLTAVLTLLDQAEQDLATGFRTAAEGHAEEPDIHDICHNLAAQCEGRRVALAPLRERYGSTDTGGAADRLGTRVLSEARPGPLGLLRDLQDLYVQAAFAELTWDLLQQAGAALHDRDMLAVSQRCAREASIQQGWLRTRSKQAAPQTLVLAR